MTDSKVSEQSRNSRLKEVALLFLRLGFTAFGGPAAHIAMMRDEVVGRRKWVSEPQFLDLLGVSNLIPGPTSTELAIYLGYVRAGWPGLVLAGTLFILPATLIVLVLAWAYVRYGSTPEGTAIFYGIKPVIIVIIGYALWGLTKAAAKRIDLGLLGITVFALCLLGVSPIALLFGGGLLVMFIDYIRRAQGGGLTVCLSSLGLPSLTAAPIIGGLGIASLAALFLEFLKIGALVYGSGYVLLAFLRDDFVTRLGWLSDRQLLDAVAVGQFTPGPSSPRPRSSAISSTVYQVP